MSGAVSAHGYQQCIPLVTKVLTRKTDKSILVIHEWIWMLVQKCCMLPLICLIKNTFKYQY